MSTDRVRQAQQAYDRAVARNRVLGARYDVTEQACEAGKITEAKKEMALSRFMDSVNAMDAAKAALDRAKRDSADRVRYAQQALDRAVARNRDFERQAIRADQAFKAGKITDAKRELAWSWFDDSVAAVDDARVDLRRAKWRR